MAERIRSRPLGLAALALVAVEAISGAVGGSTPVLALAALIVAPGLAFVPLLPERARTWTGALAAAPAAGTAVSAVVLISIASAGIELTGVSVRVALAAVALVSLLVLEGPEVDHPLDRRVAVATLGLLAAVALGVALEQRVIGGAPVPGNDWAKYLLYAEEIRREGALLIDNPYWMLGVPFREDPAAPALLGSYLTLTGLAAASLAHGIWVFAIAGILSTFAFVRAFWGELAGVLAAGIWAALPIGQDILAWHGLPNVAALALFPIALLYLTALLDEELPLRAAVGFALVLVAVAAMHRFSALVIAAALLATLALALLTPARRRVVRSALMVGAAAAAVCAGVAFDLVSRARSFGGTQEHTAYLTAKVDLALVASDLTYVFTAAAATAVLLAAWWSRKARALWPLLCTLAVVALLAYGWVFDLPLVYFRMAYFLPVALAPLVAIALTQLLSPRSAALGGVALIAVVAAFAWGQARNVRDFYAFANDNSLRALDALETQLGSREVVVTDRCWSFLATWLLRTPTLPALEPEDIQPKAELIRARQARAILDGTPEGRSLAKKLRVRYLLVAPTCPDAAERPARPPAVGDPVFVSERLVVLRLPQGRAQTRRAETGRR